MPTGDPVGSRVRLLKAGAALVVVVALGVDLAAGPGLGDLARGGRVPFPVVAVVMAAVYALLLVRWRRPRSALAALLGLGLLNLVLPNLIPLAGLLVALHATGRRLPRRSATVGLALSLALMVVFAERGAAERVNVATGFLLSLLGQWSVYAVLAVVAWALGRIAAVAAERAAQQEEEAARTAREHERARLARDLHDTVTHAVTGMIMQAAATRTAVEERDAGVADALLRIQEAGVQAMGELHLLLGLLRAGDGGEPEPREQRGLDDVPQLLEQARQSGLRASLAVAGRPGALDRSVDAAAYRVVQEAVTNAMKYAGPGAAVEVEVGWTAPGVRITVRDLPSANVSAEPSWVSSLSSGHGLDGLAERLRLLGGQLSHRPSGRGFVVVADLPFSVSAPRPGPAPRPGDPGLRPLPLR